MFSLFKVDFFWIILIYANDDYIEAHLKFTATGGRQSFQNTYIRICF